MDIQSHQSGLPPGQEAEEQQNWKSQAWFPELLGNRVIKEHSATAMCSVGCLTLHLTSGFSCLCSTGNRKAYKLQRGTPGVGEKEPVGRRGIQGLGKMGILYPVLYPLCLNLSLFCNRWIQQDQKMTKFSKEKWMELSMA